MIPLAQGLGYVDHANVTAQAAKILPKIDFFSFTDEFLPSS